MEILISKPSLTIKAAERYFKRVHDRGKPETTTRDYMISNILANHSSQTIHNFVQGTLLQFSWLGHQKAGKKTYRYSWQKIFLKENIFIINIIYYENFEKR